MMEFLSRQNTARCPYCDARHEIIQALPESKETNAQVVVCPILPDLIYVNKITRPRVVRDLIKQTLFGK